jgi:hypothetical protein
VRRRAARALGDPTPRVVEIARDVHGSSGPSCYGLRTTLVEVCDQGHGPVIHGQRFAAASGRDVAQRRADGTSSLEIGPAFFQPRQQTHYEEVRP